MLEKIRKKEITLIMAVLLVLGELYALLGTLSVEEPIVAAGCGICGAVIACVAARCKDRGWIVYGLAFGLSIILALVMLPTFTDGCAELLNLVIDDFKQLHPRNYTVFHVEGDGGNALRLVVGIFAFLLGISTGEIVKKPHSVLFYVHMGGGLLLLLVFGVRMQAGTMTAAVMCGGLMYLLRVSDGASQKRETLQKAAARTWLRLGVLFCVIIAGAGVFPAFSNSDLPAAIAEHCSEVTDNMRYGNNLSSGLTGGKLSTAGKQERTEESVLKVTMTEPTSYYLRGFVGETYENNRWKGLDKEVLYQNGDLFYWLHEDGFYAQKQIVQGAQASGIETKTNRVTIENLNASTKYLYLPYEMAEDSYFDAEGIGDSYTLAKGFRGTKTYGFETTENLIVKYQKIGSKLQQMKNRSENGRGDLNIQAQTYLDDEAGYNSFVYQNYTQIPMEIEQYLAEKLGDYVIENGQTHFDYQAAKQNILYYLGKSVKYAEETDAVDGDIDFVLNFLDGSKKGYDVHYASAAVMLFRYYGIPARYMEGYLITKEDSKKMKPDEPYYIDGTHAHAWAEYYQDGVGWLPFETTPSYLSVMEKTEKYRDISGLLGQKVGSKRADQAEEQQSTEPDSPKLKMFWIKHKVTILLVASLAILTLLIALFLSWLIHERKKAACRKAAFAEGNAADGIRRIHAYMMDVLVAWGLEPRNCNPIEYAAFVEEEFQDTNLTTGYRNVQKLWEEAKFSNHEMSEEDRQQVLQINEELWERIWTHSGFFTRMKLKYVYFL